MKRAVTVIELLAVIGITVILMLAAAGSWQIGMNAARVQQTRAELVQIASELYTRKAIEGTFCQTLPLRLPQTDAWGHAFIYQNNQTSFTLFSQGASVEIDADDLYPNK